MTTSLINRDDLLFYITVETIQDEALEKISRYLTQDELFIAKKGLEWGLMTGIDAVYSTIFFEMIQKT